MSLERTNRLLEPCIPQLFKSTDKMLAPLQSAVLDGDWFDVTPLYDTRTSENMKWTKTMPADAPGRLPFPVTVFVCEPTDNGTSIIGVLREYSTVEFARLLENNIIDGDPPLYLLAPDQKGDRGQIALHTCQLTALPGTEGLAPVLASPADFRLLRCDVYRVSEDGVGFHSDFFMVTDMHGVAAVGVVGVEGHIGQVSDYFALTQALSVSNIRHEAAPGRVLSRATTRRLERSGVFIGPIRHHTLSVTVPNGTETPGSGKQRMMTGASVPFHKVRGHFADYRKRPLFGKYRGVFFVPAHMRGNPGLGIVTKDYLVNPPDPRQPESPPL